MGTASEDMARSTHLLVVLATFTFLPLPSAQQSCCKKKIVSGKVADDAGLSGTYTLIEGKTTQESACADGCVYSRDSGNSGNEYCFKVADPGADIQDEECAAVTGTTAAGSQSTLSSDELRNQAQDAANRIKENNEKVVQGEQNVKNAEDAQKAMKDIVEDLEEARKSRGKRQEPATVQPVAKPTDCPGFTDTWKKLLALAADGVSDNNIDQIKAYIDALKDVDVKNLCTKAERDDIVSNNKDDYDKASSETDTYLMNEQKEVTDLKLKVNDDIKLLKEINQKLEDRNEPPVSTVAVSTYKIDPTVPAGGETTKPSSGGETSPDGEKSTPADGATSVPTSDGGMTSKPPSDGKTSPAGEMSSKPSSDGETSPAGGMTSKPPSDGQTSPSAGMTSKPDGGETSKLPTGGETSKPPTGGETSPAGGQTSQPPSGGESTPSKPGAVSTAKPQRRSFLERKRSRGSIM